MRLALACVLTTCTLAVAFFGDDRAHSSNLNLRHAAAHHITVGVTFNDTLATQSETAHSTESEFKSWNVLVLSVGWALILAAGIGTQIWEAAKSDAGIGGILTCETLKGSQPLHIALKENLLPATTVTLVSIPLSMALGIASGAGPVTGLITAFVAGGVAGTFGSSAFNIVGPAGALAGLLMRYSMIYGPEILPWLSLVSALLVFLATSLKLHIYCMFMPKCVFEGFTLGVALTIGLGQLDAAFGLKLGALPHVHGVELSPLMFKLAASFQAWHTIQLSSALFFIIGTVGMLLLFKWKPAIPWPVPFAGVALLIGALCDPEAFGVIDVPLSTLRMRYGFLEPKFAIPLVPLNEIIQRAEEQGGTYGDFMVGSMSVAFVAVLETLISAKIGAVKGGMDFDTEGELWGLGLAHVACGICGVMPPTGVFVRTSVNLRTGATHKTSQAVHALFVAILLGLCIRSCSFLPESAVAAILIVSSIRMAPLDYIAKTWDYHKHTFALLMLVAVLCVAIDSVIGLAVGTIVGLLWIAKETAQGHAEVSLSTQGGKRNEDGTPKMITIDAMKMDQTETKSAPGRRRASLAFDSPLPDPGANIGGGNAGATSKKRISNYIAYSTRDAEESKVDVQAMSVKGDRVYLYRFLGQVSYLNGEKHAERLAGILEGEPKAVVLDLGHVPWIDPDGLEALEQTTRQLQMAGVKVIIAAPRPLVHEGLIAAMAGPWEGLLEPQDIFSSVQLGLEAAMQTGSKEGDEEGDSGKDNSAEEDEEPEIDEKKTTSKAPAL